MSMKVLLLRSIARNKKIRFYAVATILALSASTVFLIQSLYTYTLGFEQIDLPDQQTVTSFPVGVRPAQKRIIEMPEVEQFFKTNIVRSDVRQLSQRSSWWKKAFTTLASNRVWQQVASPMTRVLVIWPGERKEQAVDLFGDILNWSSAERQEFSDLVIGANGPLTEGMFYPGKYVVSKDATPQVVADIVNTRFSSEITERYTDEVAQQVPLQQALIIASLLEREAYDFTDMRVISGVIWNRLFSDMNLQIDATLQYVKGSRPYGPWWPVVRPADKYLESAYNTYQNAGLPPAPIANPSAESVLAALNPRKTECYYYFHADDGTFYCSVTYKEHVQKLKEVFGRGK